MVPIKDSNVHYTNPSSYHQDRAPEEKHLDPTAVDLETVMNVHHVVTRTSIETAVAQARAGDGGPEANIPRQCFVEFGVLFVRGHQNWYTKERNRERCHLA